MAPMQPDAFDHSSRISIGEGAEFMDEILIEMTSLGSVVIAMFGAAFCLMQTRHTRVSRSFATFLAAIALNNIPDAFTQLLSGAPTSYTSVAAFITWPSSFFLAPLFWLYVSVLTSPHQEMPKRLAWHFALPVAAIVTALLVLLSPPMVRDTLFSQDPVIETGWMMTLAVLIGLLQITLLPQIAIYLILIFRRLLRFRIQLRDVYSSTERHELRWIYVIGSLCALFWLAATLLLIGTLRLGDAPPSFLIFVSIEGFVLVCAVTLWGIRQRPPLAPDRQEEALQTKSQPSGKYEKSALSPEASARLSRKLRNAMEVDHLHRDANLSLWTLARHIGASSNHVSQTLNEVIGGSFFDFVNSYRIAEAKTLLSTTEDSVLNITYDVGFNARSSFYNAFKRHTGQTPTAYRKDLSQRDGVDDFKGQLRDT
ncbi:MAG: AraC family transcriptional regulator [Pseudomonadota bacterium]